MEIIPGILEKEWEEIEKKLQILSKFAKTVHIDIIDGKFTNNITFLDPKPFKKYSKDLFLELHMMVVNPISYLKPFAASGFRRFLGHVEKMPSQAEFIAQGQLLGEVGLALDGPTQIEEISSPFHDLDAILVFTSDHIGSSGTKLNREKLEKIKLLSEKASTPIEADGGINNETIKLARDAGATRFVATSFLSNNPQKAFDTLLDLVT